jgi:hypothetical protein
MIQPRQARGDRLQVSLALVLLVMVSSCGPSDAAKSTAEIARPRRAERTPVTSSNLQSVGYDEESRTLTIEFRNGTVYEYADVPSEVHDELMNAESHGRYFHRRIREAGYKTRRLDGPVTH